MATPQPPPTFIEFWRHEACKYSTQSNDPLLPALTKALDVLAVAGDPNYDPVRLQRTLASLKSESELSYSFENTTKPDPCRVLMYGVLLSMHSSFSQMVVRVDGDDVAAVAASESQESAAASEESAIVPDTQSPKRKVVRFNEEVEVSIYQPQFGDMGEAAMKEEVEVRESNNIEQSAFIAQEEFPLFDNTIKNDDEIKQEPIDEEEYDPASDVFSLYLPDTRRTEFHYNWDVDEVEQTEHFEAPKPPREEEVVTTDGDEEMGVEEVREESVRQEEVGMEEGEEDDEEEEDVDSDNDSDDTYIQSDDEFAGMPILEKML